jgi:hypothetical protein
MVTLSEPAYICDASGGGSVGDIYTRSGKLKLTEDVDFVGEYYPQATSTKAPLLVVLVNTRVFVEALLWKCFLHPMRSR